MDERQHLRELVAGHDELQPDARVAETVGALEHEPVVDAAGRSRLLRLVDERVRSQVDGPVARGALARQRERRVRCQCLRRRLAHVRLGDAPREAVERAVGPEAQQRLVDRAGAEQPHVPPERRVGAALDQAHERFLAAAFELDVALRGGVLVEHDRRARTGGHEPPLRRERLGLRDRRLARHRDVDVDERDRVRKQLPGARERGKRRHHVRDPERRPAVERGRADGRRPFRGAHLSPPTGPAALIAPPRRRRRRGARSSRRRGRAARAARLPCARRAAAARARARPAWRRA